MLIVLSIDGGGIRGIIPTLILSEIEKKLNKHPTEIFDMFVGTSTGGIIISSLNIKEHNKPKYNSKDIFNFYLNNSKYIFSKNNFFTKIKTIFYPKYKNIGLYNLLKYHLKDYLLLDTIKPCLIPTYDIINNNVIIFKSRKDKITLLDACMSTTAAPTYLPRYDMIYNNILCGFIDGGIYANNPSLIGLAEVLKHGNFYYKKNIELKDIKLLSIGTGSYKGVENPNIKSNGLIYWAKRIADVMMKGVSQTSDYQLKEVLPKENYLRIQVDIKNPKRKNMDDSSNDTLYYLINETNTQIINNSIMNKIIEFINKEKYR